MIESMGNRKISGRTVLKDILIPSLRRLYGEDYENILFGVSERNICARLAFHIETIMREYDKDKEFAQKQFVGYHADVEYNRMGYGDLKYYLNNRDQLKYMVSDLLVQKRGYGGNLLAIEMKRKGNYRNVKEDRDRLRSLATHSDNYDERCIRNTTIGTYIVYSAEGVDVELYEDKGTGGKMTQRLHCYYKDGSLSQASQNDSMTDPKDAPSDYPVYDENYLNGLIAKASKSWSGVDV